MSLPSATNNLLAVAAAEVSGASGASPDAYGCTTAKSGPGVYTCNLPAPGVIAGNPAGKALPAIEAYLVLTLKGQQAPAFIQYEDTSDYVKTIRTFNGGGSPEDRDFELVAFRLPSEATGATP